MAGTGTGTEEQKNTVYDYAAFISYRHRPLDQKAAMMVQKSIENYRVPKGFRDRTGGKERFGKVFRDEDELPVAGSLSDGITTALDHSQFLIVICTPDLPDSEWCEQEIRYFLETHDRDHVLAVLADGEPEESFSPWMLHEYDADGNVVRDVEPLAANIAPGVRKERVSGSSGAAPGSDADAEQAAAGERIRIDRKIFNKEIVRIYAALLNCPFDALWQRERRARTNRLFAASGVLTAAMAVFLGVVLVKNAQITAKNEEITAQNLEIEARNKEISAMNAEITEQNTKIREINSELTDKNTQITEQNEKITAQNISLERQMSSMTVDSGFRLFSSFDESGAIRSALSALSSRDPDIYDHRAEKLLADALGACLWAEGRSTQIYAQQTEIADLAVTADGGTAVLSDSVGVIRAVDTQSGEVLWETSTRKSGGIARLAPELFLSGSEKTVIAKCEDSVHAFRLEDGEEAWSYAQTYTNPFRAVSGDGKVFVLADQDYSGDHKTSILFFDADTGEQISEARVGDGVTEAWLFAGHWSAYGTGFSKSGRSFACAFYEQAVETGKEDSFGFYLIDVATGEVLKTGHCGYESSVSCVFFGIDVDEENDRMVSFMYHPSYGSILTTVLDGKSGTVTTESTNHTPDEGDWDLMGLSRGTDTIPMVSAGRMAALVSGKTLFLFSLEDGKLMRSLSIPARVRDLRWLSEEEEVLGFLTAGGDIGMFDLDSGGEMFLPSYTIDDFDQTDIRLICMTGRGLMERTQYQEYLRTDEEPPFNAFFIVPESDPGKLLLAREVSDPEAMLPGIPEDTIYTSTGIFGGLEEETVLGSFYTSSYSSGKEDSFVLRSYDPETLEVLDEAVFGADGLFSSDAAMACRADGTSVIVDTRIYSLDGGTRFLEFITDENHRDFDRDMRSVRTSDGHLLSTADLTGSYKLSLIPVWLDEVLVPESNEQATGVALSDGQLFDPGKNGYILGYGVLVPGPEAPEEELADTEPKFVAFRAEGGVRTKIADIRPEETVRKAVLGEVSPVFAVSYGSGAVAVGDLETGEMEELPVRYSPGEVLQIAFAGDDRFLAVLRSTGYTDLVRLESGETELSLEGSYVKEYIRSMDTINCVTDEDADRMYITVRSSGNTYGSLFIVDTGSMTNTLVLDLDTYGYCPLDGRIWRWSYFEKKLVAFPARTLAELEAWAGERLEGEETD